MATSTIPAALTALLSILRAADDLDGVQVIDGPPDDDQSDQDYLYIGWQPDGEVAVDSTQDFAHIGARRRDEHYDILCYLETWTGDSDMAVRRARAFVLLGAVEDALRATAANPDAPDLNGAVLWAHLTQASLIEEKGPDGTAVGIPFRITCRARI